MVTVLVSLTEPWSPHGEHSGPLQRDWRYYFRRCPLLRDRLQGQAFSGPPPPPPRPVFGLRWATFTERSRGVAAIVCDTTANTVRQGYCYTCLAIGRGIWVGSLRRGSQCHFLNCRGECHQAFNCIGLQVSPDYRSR